MKFKRGMKSVNMKSVGGMKSVNMKKLFRRNQIIVNEGSPKIYNKNF